MPHCHCFVRQLITFLPKEHTIYATIRGFCVWYEHENYEWEPHDVVSYVTSFVVFNLFSHFLYVLRLSDIIVL